MGEIRVVTVWIIPPRHSFTGKLLGKIGLNALWTRHFARKIIWVSLCTHTETAHTKTLWRALLILHRETDSANNSTGLCLSRCFWRHRKQMTIPVVAKMYFCSGWEETGILRGVQQIVFEPLKAHRKLMTPQRNRLLRFRCHRCQRC